MKRINMREMDEAEFKRVTHGTMPRFNRQCDVCGALCFDTDHYCAECGTCFDDEGGENNNAD